MRYFRKQTERLAARFVNQIVQNYLDNENIMADDFHLRFLPGPSEEDDPNYVPKTIFVTREVAG